MPSFLSKVFGRKKDDKESPRSSGRASDPSLLEGKFESVSPSATKFPEVPNGKSNGHGKEKEKDSFALFRAKSRPASPDLQEKRHSLPQLSLNLPGQKEDSTSRTLGVVFEADPEAHIILGETTLGERQLSPQETLVLIRACSQAITARGLETLGIMHPHWYSASPDVQRRLISLFIQSLAPKSPITTLSPTPAFVSAFESEISSTRSPHDVAAVLRWGLRHLRLEGQSFGRAEGWYTNFLDAERSSGYPPNAFSTQLAPQLPATHLELLSATLEIFSSLAAHAEANGISGSKLSKFFGLWLLTSQRAQENDDWSTFYARWENTGRMLEHLFLSRIRDEATKLRMPTRLSELVHRYPYAESGTQSLELNILSRPRFSTRRYDALFVRMETELPMNSDPPKHNPMRLITEAFRAGPINDSGPHTNLWEIIKKTGTDSGNEPPDGLPNLSLIFADETIRFLSLPFDSQGDTATSSDLALFHAPKTPATTRRRSFSMSDRDRAIVTAAANGHSSTTQHTKPATDPSPYIASPISGTDWTEFSTTGFFESVATAKPLAATLLDKNKDVEVTVPRSIKRPKASPIFPINGRKSLDTPQSAFQKVVIEEKALVSQVAQISIVQLDEAFVDFWSDALLDPISSNWPTFIICKFKASLADVEANGKKLNWLVIEQSFKKPQIPATPDSQTSEAARKPRPSSPRPSYKSDMSSTRHRFSFFTSGRTSTSSVNKSMKGGKKKGGQSPRTGEMGEILAEEDEKVETVKLRMPSPKPRKSGDTAQKSVDAVKKSIEIGKKDQEPSGVGAATGSVAAAVETAQSDAVNSIQSSLAGAHSNGTAVSTVKTDVTRSEAVSSPNNETAAPPPTVELASVTEESEVKAKLPVVSEVTIRPEAEPTAIVIPPEDIPLVEVSDDTVAPMIVETPVNDPTPSKVEVTTVEDAASVVSGTSAEAAEVEVPNQVGVSAEHDVAPIEAEAHNEAGTPIQAIISSVATSSAIEASSPAEDETIHDLHTPVDAPTHPTIETPTEISETVETLATPDTPAAPAQELPVTPEPETSENISQETLSMIGIADEPALHIEPLHALENDRGNHDVDLAPVPIVDVLLATAEASTPQMPAVHVSDDTAEVAPPISSPHVNPAVEEPSSALETVVASGSTPGPEMALSASEPAAPIYAVDSAIEVNELTNTGTVESQPAEAVADPPQFIHDTPAKDIVSPPLNTTNITEPSLDATTQAELMISVDHDDSMSTPAGPAHLASD